MAVPEFQSIMLPLLKLLKDGQERTVGGAIDPLAETLKLSEEDKKEILPSGKQKRFNNRVAWAKAYLGMAGLVETPTRGKYKITQRGLDVLKQNPERIDRKFLEKFSEFQEFQKRTKRKTSSNEEIGKVDSENPEETLGNAYQELRDNLARDLLDKVKQSPPDFFERLVVDLLVKMGYGGSIQDAGRAIGRSGDEGIDGVIKEDRLGLDVIYIQAKRWEATVGRPEIQKFAGALQGQSAKKGIFITTSNFSREARGFVDKIEVKIVLIDGEQLAEFMIDHNVGVSPFVSYDVKKIDWDYFEEE